MRVPARRRAALALTLVAALGAGGCTDSGGRPGDDITDTVPVPGFVLDPTGASLSPDTSRIAVPCHERVCVWGIGGDLEQEVEGTAGTAWTDGLLVVGGSRELVVDPAGERAVLPVPGEVRGVAGAAQGSPLVAVLEVGVVIVADGVSTVVDLRGVLDVAFSPDASRVVVATQDAPVQVVDLASARTVGTLGDEVAEQVAWSPDGRFIATGGADGSRLYLAERLGRDSVPEAELTDPAVADLAFAPTDGTLAVADADDGQLVLWQPVTDETTVLDGHPSASGKVLWSPGGSLYSVASDAVLAWDTETGTVASTFDLPPFE